MICSLSTKFITLRPSMLKATFNNLTNYCSIYLVTKANFSTSSSNSFGIKDMEPKKWLQYNEKIYPPQEAGEERRPAVSLKIDL